MALKDIPQEKFPLLWEDYSEIYDQLDKACARFQELGYDDLAYSVGSVRVLLTEAWDKITQAEMEGR